ncbi:MAG: hypothetical protein ACK4Z0_09520 [Sphingomonadaceae bacterium]
MSAGRLALLPALALLVAAPGAAGELAGRYALVGMREAAGGLELTADGRFRWAFTMGALDEMAEGRWRREGNRLLLTTEPAPRPPRFEPAGQEAGEPGVLALMLEDTRGRPIANIGVEVRMDDGSVEQGQTLGEWLEADLDGRRPVSVRFTIPVFEVESADLPLDVPRAHRYRFRLDPGDLGVRDFRDWPLTIEGDLLRPPGAPPGQGFRRQAR